ncbi:MAG: TonB-dependent receptor [Ginsengibacter sp.]
MRKYTFMGKWMLNIFILLATASFTQAQKGTIKGVVKDERGPLANASVTIEGKNNGTTTNDNGEYIFKVDPGSYNIIISYVGLKLQRIPVSVSAGETVTVPGSPLVAQQTLEGVLIVGSRSNVARTSVQTAVPVDIISAKDLTATGQVEPTQMLNFVAPSFNSSRQTIADGTDHIDPATLRGLGPDQVLVLVDGKRYHNTALINVNGTIGRGSVGTDLNSLPPSAIERIEVLRDGAAAQYGSDAIAGVINVVLKKAPSPATFKAYTGAQYAGDGFVYNFGLNKGLKLGKQGYLNFSGDFRHREPTERSGIYTGTVYTSNVAQDNQIIADRGFSREHNLHIGQSKLLNTGFVVSAGAPIKANSNTQIYFTGSYNYREGQAAGFYRYPKQTSQVIAELYPDGFLPYINSKINDKSLSGGIKGISKTGWNWDVSDIYGGNSFRFDVTNSNNSSQFAQGAIAQTEFYAGTLKFNQNTFNVSFSKDLAQKVNLQSFNLAFGAEYRIDNYQILAGEEASYKNYDPNSGRVGGAQVFPGFQPENAVDENRNVFAGYVDLESDLGDKFLADVSGRYEYYSDFGSNVAGKLAMRYKISDHFSLRGGISNGFRAPSIHQRFFSAVSTVFINTTSGTVPFQQGTFRNNSDIAAAFGIPSLTAEKSINYSLGITSKPARNVSITIDAYQIEIRDRIVLTGSFTKSNPTVAAILANYPDVNSAIFFTNAINTRTQGIDIVTSADLKINNGSLNITLAGNLNKTRLFGDIQTTSKLPPDSLNTNTLFNIEEKGRIEQGQPDTKFALSFNYKINKWNLVFRTTRFGKVSTIFNGTDRTRDEYFSDKYVSDVALSFRPAKIFQITIGANNIADVYPDKLKNFANTSDNRFQYSRNSTQFGFNGGFYYASLNFTF